jgi:hypothetical protein
MAWSAKTSVIRSGVRLAAACMLLLVASGCGMGPGTNYTADWSRVQVPEGTFVTTGDGRSEQQYKDDCKHVNYNDYRESSSAHRGEDVYFKGPFTWVGQPSDELPNETLAESGTVALSMGLGALAPEGYDTAVTVFWPGALPAIPDGSIVEVWGDCQGTYSETPIEWPKLPVVRGRYLTVHAE